jgi:nitroreductase
VSNKVASNDNPILDVLKRRWSPRAFADRAVPPETLRSLFEAARWTQSSANEQPWRFAVALRSDTAWHETLASALSPGNAWATKAPVLGLTVAKAAFTNSNSPNRVAIYDAGAAMMGLTVQATAMDLYVHQMAGFDLNVARQAAGVPEGFDPVAMFALGYLGDPETLNPDHKAREIAPRTRKPLPEFVFGGQWGRPAL